MYRGFAIALRLRGGRFESEDFRDRTPLKFGGVPISEDTLSNAWLTVEAEIGNFAQGFGSMPLGNMWAWHYTPVANEKWEGRFPGLFRTTNGTLKTGQLADIGLGTAIII